MSQENLPKTEVLYLAKRLIAEKKEYAFQPIYSGENKIELPLNHYNGTPRCVFDGQQYKKTQEHVCQYCKKSYKYQEIYYDLSLHQILQTVWENPQYFHTKSVKMYRNGAWEVFTVDAVETQCEGVIDEIFSSLNQEMASQLIGANDKAYISQNPNLYPQVKQILERHLNLQKQDIQHLTEGMTFTQVMQQPTISGMKVTIPKLNIQDDAAIGLVDRKFLVIFILSQTRDQVKEALMYDDTQIVVVQDKDSTVYMIGTDKNDSGRSNGYKKTYRLSASQYLMDQSMKYKIVQVSFSKPICVFQEFATLNEQRYQFKMVHYKNFLFVIGGNRIEFKEVDGRSERNNILVHGVERLDLTNPNPQWITVATLPFSIHSFNHKLVGSVLTITDGQIAEASSSFMKQSGNQRQTIKFDLDKLQLV